MFSPKKMFSEALYDALKGIVYNKTENVYEYGLYAIEGSYYDRVHFSYKTNNLKTALTETLISFFEKFFTKIHEVTHFKGLRVQGGYTDYRNNLLKFDIMKRELPELQGVF